MDKGFFLHHLISQVFKALNFSPHVIAACSSMTAIYSLVRCGVGASLLPASMYLFKEPCIEFFSLSDLRESRPITMSYHKTQYMSYAAKEFIHVFREIWG
jgi:DNA-binding transcriptional LysR family regulator